jgi:hypothetical protein
MPRVFSIELFPFNDGGSLGTKILSADCVTEDQECAAREMFGLVQNFVMDYGACEPGHGFRRCR